jgi:hypothetical protein
MIAELFRARQNVKLSRVLTDRECKSQEGWIMRNFFAIVAMLFCLCALSMAAPPPDHEIPPPDPARELDNDTFINANDILMFVTNQGGFCRDLSNVFGYDVGTFYPYTSVADIEMGTNTTSPLYAAGLWMGGKVDGEVRVTVAEFSHEYCPGPMVDGSHQPDDPDFRVYKLFSDSLAGNPNDDYVNWPTDQGAPVDGTGWPDGIMLGDQMLWTVFNDDDPEYHDVGPGRSEPLGIEVQQTVWAYDGSDNDTIFVSNEIPVTQAGNSHTEVSVYSSRPDQVTGHDYAVEVDNSAGGEQFWLIRDVTTGAVVLPAQTDFSGDSAFTTDLGFGVVVKGQSSIFSSFQVVANASGPIDPPESGAVPMVGFPTPPGPNADGRPSDNQQVGDGKWLFHTADNGGTNGGGDRGSYERFVERVIRGDNAGRVTQSDWEMRFTGSNDNPGVGGSYVIEWYNDDNVFWVPFELWSIGTETPDDPSDDYQMYAYALDNAGVPISGPGDDAYAIESWGISSLGGGDLEHSVSGGNDDPFTDWIYWRNPDDMTPGTAGYDDIEADLLAGTYDGRGEEVFARTVLVNLNGGEQPLFTQDCPEQGTVFRILTGRHIVPDTFSFTPTAGQTLTTGAEESSIYFKYKLYNKGDNAIEDFFITIWVDPDLGWGYDDLVGCDTLGNTFFCYNATNFDSQYGLFPPIVGFKVIDGPVVPAPGQTAIFDGNPMPDHANIGMYSFQYYINGTDPNFASEAYNYMQGFLADGSPLPNGTRYAYPGDPVAGTGDLDFDPDDRRMMASFGPFDFLPGDSQYVFFKMSVGPGGNRSEAMTRMTQYLNYEPPILAAHWDPDTLYMFWTNSIDPIPASLTIGWWGDNPGSSTPNPATIQITDVPAFDSVQVLSGVPGFDGDVVRVHFPVKEFILAQGLLFDYADVPFTVTGEFMDGSPLEINSTVIIGGHISGDVTGDGSIDITDLIYIVKYMFQDGPAPRIMRQADVNASGGPVDISDLIYLVSYMFQGGPPPHCQ